MKQFKCDKSPKIRTVTEIINGNEKLHKDYDLAEFDAKNLNSLESYDTLKIKLVIVKYMAMLNTLQLTQPLLTIFRDRQAARDIVAIVVASLGFVHNRVHPLVNNFDNRMEFVVTDRPDIIIPGEPLMFRLNDREEIVCTIDRLSIVKMLERQFDTDMSVGNIIKEKQKVKLMKTFAPSRKRKPDEFESLIKISEMETTQYVTLLFIIEHAYGHYSILKNYGIFNYSESLLDHTIFANKCKPTLNSNYSNMLLSKFKFRVEDTEKSSNKTNIGILSYNS
ncbi:occlusion derived viral protein-e27 [Helicoverpa armigera multiple nucleopolyhedrovirus]|uniref:Odv-ec27 n=2 Tax=Alphabaculovirus TaxID=558016 RepID=I3XMH2_NPVMB|nr:putative ODVprotein [Mamestra configurata nucleopolyhedrovirus B]YP_009011219.1 odv-ec27 [Mamestra brassicae multiple nucleopolyhedrovirus]ACH88680.1 occlusion derived viral protein-e27 [Helicoverpa armigera multiple nucleopolyhedrovirus]WNA17537.1 odv-ec27 [Alphabaculovirus mabrassicae]AAM95150.1 putative ODV-EC27-like protein [Mamestra configurata nucleopolyhedrovirus B]AFL65005.1 odv-ec27 [Mamestra brassicae multiple nucleopolyhedrovirus]AFP95878.1 odv-ec27 [Mamestra brassicae multiple 